VGSKTVELRESGKRKVGDYCIQTTDKDITYEGTYVIITSSDTGKTYTLDIDDIAFIK
jgi:hypothetical protein